MGMVTSAVDFSQMKDIFGTEIEHVDMLRLYLDAQKVPAKKVKEKMAWAKKTFGSVNVSDNVLEKSVRLYFAMKDVMKTDGYAFGGFKCQPEFIDNYVSGCMPISWLINEGTMMSCEADMNAAFSMRILHLISGQPVLFADVNDFDIYKRTSTHNENPTAVGLPGRMLVFLSHQESSSRGQRLQSFVL